jgi:hypothetical protein
MIEEERRNFLLTGRDMVLGALTAGTLVACVGTGTVHAQASSPSLAAFGWEINNLGVGGGAVSSKVLSNVVLDIVDADVSFSPLSPPTQPGFSDVLCRGQVSRGGPPSFTGSEVNFFPQSSPQFGPVEAYNPGGCSLGQTHNRFRIHF